MKLKPEVNMRAAISKIEAVLKKIVPSAPFDYKFVDEQYAKKFAAEERLGNLTTFFAILAILISLLGIFGLASFVAEQRIKEIGIRKVLGASVAQCLAIAVKRFCGFSHHFMLYRCANGILFHAQLASKIHVSNRYFMVGFCCGKWWCFVVYAFDNQFPSHKSGGGESCEIVADGVIRFRIWDFGFQQRKTEIPPPKSEIY